MKFLSTFKITKGFDTWLEMYKEIEPDLNELGIKNIMGWYKLRWDKGIWYNWS